MSNWFDILYGEQADSSRMPGDGVPGKQPAPVVQQPASAAQRPAPVAPATQPAPEVQRAPAAQQHAPSAQPASPAQPPRSSMRLTKDQLKIAPPLPRMPARWSLELQKAVFHLAHSEFGNNNCRSVCFSGLQRGGGNSTISYLIAHYLAAESSGLRVLFLDFSLDGRRAATQGVDGVFRIGDPVPVDFLRANTNAFARYSIRPGDENSGINCSRWFRELMAVCKQHCDWIVVDAPPFFSSPESYPVAQVCDGTVLVLKSGETRYPALNGLVADLEQMGIRTLGTIMNFRQYPVPRWLLKYI